MNRARFLYRLGSLDPAVEFCTIPAWLLFFPWKDSPLYFLIFAVLVSLVVFRNVGYMKNLGISGFTAFLVVFNLLLMFSVCFSIYRFNSILPAADLLLISVYFVLFYLDKGSETRYFRLLVYLVSLVSFFKAINYIFVFIDRKDIFFPNPIFQGVASGLAVLVLLFYLLEKFTPLDLVLLIVNVAGVFVSQSKAAFIGIAIFSIFMVVLKITQRPGEKEGTRFTRLQWVAGLIVMLIVLTFIVPNPIRKMFIHSIKKDPYSANRIDIWKMSGTIFKEHLFTGVGLNNFGLVAKKYNFKQERGPANYFKVPGRPHNDYFKLLTETGIAGLYFLLLLLFVLGKKIFSSPLFNISKILILYLLFQAFLFNLLFHVFFFFVFLFLLKNLFEERLHYSSFTRRLKTYFVFLILFVLGIGYLLPYFAQGLLKESNRSRDIMTRFSLLEKAAYLSPLDQDIHYLKALSLYGYFDRIINLESFYDGLRSLRQAQHLNPYLTKAYVLESDYYRRLSKKINYKAMPDEIAAPLIEAEKYAPLDPFIKMRKAEIYHVFNCPHEAKKAAQAALELEPDFVSALYFLHENFNHIPDESRFKSRIDEILEKKERIQPVPGSYLFDLFKLPGKAKIIKSNENKKNRENAGMDVASFEYPGATAEKNTDKICEES